MSWAMLKIRANEKGMEKAALYNGTLISIMTPLGLILGGVLSARLEDIVAAEDAVELGTPTLPGIADDLA
jgi:hypothetical protein